MTSPKRFEPPSTAVQGSDEDDLIQPEVRTRTDLAIHKHKSNVGVVQLTMLCLSGVLMVIVLCTASLVILDIQPESRKLWQDVVTMVIGAIVPLAAAALTHFLTKK